MKYASLSVVLLTVLAAPPLLARQDMTKKDASPVAATAPVARGVEFTLPVKGLSSDNATKVQSALTALSTKEYTCPDCGHSQARAGKCAKCDVALVAKEMPIFKELKASAEKGTIAFQMTPSAQVRLSTIESALRGHSVTVPRDEIQIGTHGGFVYTGAVSSEDATKLQKAFRDAKFAQAEAIFEPTDKEIQVWIHDGKPSWASASDLGSKMAKPLRLNDVLWGGRPTPRG